MIRNIVFYQKITGADVAKTRLNYKEVYYGFDFAKTL